MAKKRRKPKQRRAKPKPKPKPRWVRIPEDELRPMLREAARTGLVEAIEHCHDFWSVSDGYRNYINHQIETQAEALLAAVRATVASTIRSELSRRELANRRRKR